MGSRNGEWNVALAGASSLKGKEVRSAFEERGFPVGRMLLLDVEELQGQLAEFDGEPVIIQPISSDTFQGMDLAVFACPPSFTEQHWRQAQASGARIVDLSYLLEVEPQARLLAPLIGHAAAKEAAAPGAEIALSAHPAAMAVAGLLGLLSKRVAVRHAAVMIHAPVSERGQAGVEELHQQTINLLSFKDLPQPVFDAQVAFNMLSQHGALAQPALREEQDRIGRHLRALLGEDAVLPAVRLLQAPVFHSYSFLCFAELEQPSTADELTVALNQKPFAVCPPGETPPSLVTAAGSDEILLGTVERDPSTAAGYWFWGVLDNLRLGALNAERIAEEMFAAAESEARREPHRQPAP